MRTLLAFAIYASLHAIAFAETAAPDWGAIHAAGMAAIERRNYEEAMECFKRSWSLSLTTEQKGISANEVGQTWRLLGRTNEARLWIERAYEAMRAEPGTGRHFAIVASSLADLYRDAGDYPRAELLLQQALATKLGDDNAVAKLRNSLADLLSEEGRSDEARRLFLESLHNNGISWVDHLNALSGLAEIETQNGDREAGARKWNEVVAIAHAQKDESAEAVGLRGLAMTWLNAGDTARAEPLFRRELAIVRNNPDAQPEQVAIALSGMALVYRAQNKLALAENALIRALALEPTSPGPVHPQAVWFREMLADIYAARGEREKARDCANQALESIQRAFGEDALLTAVALVDRASVEQRSRDLDAAAADYERALAILRAKHGHDSLVKTTIERYAGLLKSMHRDREANALNTFARSFHN